MDSQQHVVCRHRDVSHYIQTVGFQQTKRLDQIEGQLDSDRTQWVLWTEVVIRQLFVPRQHRVVAHVRLRVPQSDLGQRSAHQETRHALRALPTLAAPRR